MNQHHMTFRDEMYSTTLSVLLKHVIIDRESSVLKIESDLTEKQNVEVGEHITLFE